MAFNFRNMIKFRDISKLNARPTIWGTVTSCPNLIWYNIISLTKSLTFFFNLFIILKILNIIHYFLDNWRMDFDNSHYRKMISSQILVTHITEKWYPLSQQVELILVDLTCYERFAIYTRNKIYILLTLFPMCMKCLLS